MTHTRTPSWVPLAGNALLAAIVEDNQRASDAVNRVVAEFGDDVIGDVMTLWIDVSAKYCGIKPTPGKTVALKFRSETTGLPHPIEDLAPEYVWAGRMFVARVARDRGQFAALINSLYGDDERFSASVSALLFICSNELRVRGFRPLGYMGEAH